MRILSKCKIYALSLTYMNVLQNVLFSHMTLRHINNPDL